MKKTAHITVNGVPFCTAWLGCQAGTDLQKRVAAANAGTGIEPHDVTCGHGSVKDARRIAQALRPQFRRGVKVEVVSASCPA